MSKRFTIDNNIEMAVDKVETYELSTLLDTQSKTFYFIADDPANVQCLCDRLNELHESNRRLQGLIVEMLDYIKSKGAVTHSEMKDWWNNTIMGND